MADFSGHSEKFRVTLADDHSSDDVLLEMSMEGLKVMNPAGNMTKRKIPLDHITRWSRATDRLTMFVKTPVDIEEKAVVLYGPHSVLSSLLDTLTCFCLQLVEIMEAKEEQETSETARELRAVAKNGGRRHRQLKNADEVEFWNDAEKEGWMFSQGEVMKTWRKRWFVLKDGFLFRFLTNDVTPTSKQRGIVDLSKVGDVCSGKTVTNRANSIKLGTLKGHVAYLCESETEMVEWLSALEGTVARLVRIIAGVDDGSSSPQKSAPSSGASNAKLLKQVEANFRGNSSNNSLPEPRNPGRPSSNSSFHYGGSNNYPSVAALPVMSSHQSYNEAPYQQRPPAMQQPASVYRDELGVHYGMGTGTSSGGIAGIGGFRAAGGSSQSSLPATLNIVDTQATYSSAQNGYSGHQDTSQSHGYTNPPQDTHMQPQMYNYPSHNTGNSNSHMTQRGEGMTLPDTLTVTSIIDQPPAQQPVYGSFPAPQGHEYPQQSAPPAWETHYSNGTPYYYNRATGQTQWTSP